MRVNRIQSYYNYPSFTSMIISEPAQTYINEHLNQKQLARLEKYKKELDDLKWYDLKINLGEHNRIIAQNINKVYGRHSNEGPLYALNISGNKVLASAVDNIEGENDIMFINMCFNNENNAEEAYRKLRNHQFENNKTHSCFNKIEWAVNGVKYLDETFDKTPNKGCID